MDGRGGQLELIVNDLLDGADELCWHMRNLHGAATWRPMFLFLALHMAPTGAAIVGAETLALTSTLVLNGNGAILPECNRDS